MAYWLTKAQQRGATLAHLEVAADNLPALRLYEVTGFALAGRRHRHCARQSGPKVDALLMQRSLPPGSTFRDPGSGPKSG